MQCLRHHHLEVKRELHGGGGIRIDGQEWRASREKVIIIKTQGLPVLCVMRLYHCAWCRAPVTTQSFIELQCPYTPDLQSQNLLVDFHRFNRRANVCLQPRFALIPSVEVFDASSVDARPTCEAGERCPWDGGFTKDRCCRSIRGNVPNVVEHPGIEGPWQS